MKDVREDRLGMDWYLDARDEEAVRALRGDLVAYLRRHVTDGSDVDGAEIVMGELLANVARHAAGPSWVSVEWPTERPVVAVHDLGPGFSLERVDRQAPREGGFGLQIVSHLVPRLEVARKRAGGSRVTAELPVRRSRRETRRSVPTGAAGLPSPEEAGPDGAFGRESFLRALVVQLARSVEEGQGPDDADDLVAGVGLAVGGRMEEEYRRVRDIAGRLTPEQMGDLYVRLKAAIGGGFYVVEANEERIVLGNTRCPFGEVVRRSPSLCRMTSSVFGGIAARNHGGSSVQLEERIAVGDPGCRVIVWLGSGERRLAHADHYDADA